MLSSDYNAKVGQRQIYLTPPPPLPISHVKCCIKILKCVITTIINNKPTQYYTGQIGEEQNGFCNE
jgi:hypothetical protein